MSRVPDEYLEAPSKAGNMSGGAQVNDGEPIKVLFLDIDGVVNCATTTERHRGFIGIDPRLAARVRRVVEATGCKVVLSSTWREEAENRAEVERKVVKIYDQTPVLNGFRGDEVSAWLAIHHEVTRYAIVDDVADWFHLGQPLFKTDPRVGLTEEMALQLMRYLNQADRLPEAGDAS
jgi:HAD domain in Swiss Army Knife RNA repair proteins